MDEYEKKAADFFTCAPRHRNRKKLANLLRATTAEALLEANVIYHMNNVPHAHLGSIEVAGRAAELRKLAASGAL